ncbi:MAG: hypothetical protein ACRDT8_00010 [Micromonosporaceae bacterium]
MINGTAGYAVVALSVVPLPPGVVSAVTRDAHVWTVVQVALGMQWGLVTAALQADLTIDERNYVRVMYGLPAYPAQVEDMIASPDTPVTPDLLPEIRPRF